MLCTGLITHSFNYLRVVKANILTSFKHFAGSIVIRMFIHAFAKAASRLQPQRDGLRM